LKNPYPRKPIQATFTTIAANKPTTGQVRRNSEIGSGMKDGSDANGRMGAATTTALALTIVVLLVIVFDTNLTLSNLARALRTGM
jgi:hypothetical protein